MASIKANWSHLCSGCFIIEPYVLTTAQCIQKIEKSNTPNYREFSVLISKTDYEIVDTKICGEYNPEAASKNSFNDFGLIKVGL